MPARLLSAALATTFATMGAGAQDFVAADHYEEICSNCHGPTAKGMASFPKLAGQDAEYLQTRLEQYRAGETVGYNTALMAPHAADLTDEQIEALASYIAETFE